MISSASSRYIHSRAHVCVCMCVSNVRACMCMQACGRRLVREGLIITAIPPGKASGGYVDSLGASRRPGAHASPSRDPRNFRPHAHPTSDRPPPVRGKEEDQDSSSLPPLLPLPLHPSEALFRANAVSGVDAERHRAPILRLLLELPSLATLVPASSLQTTLESLSPVP